MTIAKAIEIISRKSSIPNEGESFEEIEKAYDMAVVALMNQMRRESLDVVSFEYTGDYGKCACCDHHPCSARGESNFDLVVRCRDCKHYLGMAECEIEGVFCGGTNFYCAYGERKGESG